MKPAGGTAAASTRTRQRLTFGTRIGLIVVASVAAVWIGGLALFYVAQSRGAGAQPLPAQIVAIVDLLEHTPADRQRAVLDAVTSTTLQARIESGHRVEPPSMRLFVRLSERSLARELSSIGGREISVTLSDGARRTRWLAFAAPDALEIRIALATDQTLVVDTRSTQFATLFGLPVGFGAGLMGSLIALVALIVMRRETKPLAQLAAEVDRIDVDRIGAPLGAIRRGAPEIDALVDAFDRLRTRVADLMKARMSMMGGISHDVRTFATRLRLRVDAIPDDAQRARSIADIDDMIRLLDDGLLASRAGALELADELVEVDELVREEVNDRVANGASIAMRTPDAAGAMAVLGDRLALRRVVANLLDNALRYATRVEVALARQGDTIVIDVDDDGPGIPIDQRALLLEPFTRLESSRSRATGGAGLGLAIVRNLVVAHGGSVAIDDGPLGGARLTVRLPAFIDEQAG